MSKTKAWFVAAIIAALLAAVIWCLWSYAIRSFGYVSMMFAAYGFVCFIIHLGKWLEKEPIRPEDVREARDEEDARIWERV